ncbi:MAG: tyrosine-type recombinase/integrase, partial [Thermodesulfobacteriota bacterium]
VGKVGDISKADAKKLLALRKTEILQGKFKAPKKKIIPTFKQFSNEYIEFAKGNKKSWDRDMYSLRSLEPCFGNSKLSEISPIQIEKYKLERKQVVSARTVNIELVLLKRMFYLAISWDRCEYNPMHSVKLFKQSGHKERILTYYEEESLLDASPIHLKAILITALQTGMRYGEILSLTWDNVDLNDNYIHVKESKSGKGRKIPINETLRKTLQELIPGNFVSNSVSTGIIEGEKCYNYSDITSKTRWIQDPVGASSWGFKSPLRHGLSGINYERA